MSAVAVGHGLHEIRALSAPRVRDGSLGRRVDFKYVHSVHSYGWDVVRLGEPADTGREGLSEGDAHPIEVVLAEEDDGRLPEHREVQSFVELALTNAAVAEDAKHDRILTLHLRGEPEPHGEREMGGNDGIAAQETLRGVVEVH